MLVPVWVGGMAEQGSPGSYARRRAYQCEIHHQYVGAVLLTLIRKAACFSPSFFLVLWHVAMFRTSQLQGSILPWHRLLTEQTSSLGAE